MPKLLPLICCLILSGCSDTGNDVVATSSEAGEDMTIAWYDGTVDSAFELARVSEKPLFLYWGAVWCPPCQEIKNTVFKSPQFVARSKLFIPVYLDGDIDDTQAIGERFGVQGYPTMIVFSPMGEEVTRIPGGIDISRYNSVLATSLDAMRPTSMLVKLALESPESLQESDYPQLAWYSWSQDFTAVPENVDKAELFEKLAGLAEDRHPEASARLYMQSLLAWVDSMETSETAIQGESTGAFERVSRILSNPALIFACWDSVAYNSEKILSLGIFSDQEKATLKPVWAESVFSLRAHPSLSTAEQLAGWLPRLQLHFADGVSDPIPVEWTKQLHLELQAADDMTRNVNARQSVISQISYIYRKANLMDNARTLLLAELDKSSSPYYFMSSLSLLAEETGNIEEAIDWSRKAFESSRGAATRFQWGASYVRTLIRLSPDDRDTIMAVSMNLFDVLQDGHEVFAGRNFSVLSTLQTALTDWQIAALVDFEQFNDNLQQLCDTQVPESTAAENCHSLLNAEQSS